MNRLYFGWKALSRSWRWGLTLQIGLALIVAFLLARLLFGFDHPKPGFSASDLLIATSWAVFALTAPIGIFLNKAWGYFLEAPAMLPLLLI